MPGRPRSCPRCSSSLVSVKTFRHPGEPAQFYVECGGCDSTSTVEEPSAFPVTYRREAI